MTGIAVGHCARCGAAAPYFARFCPHCHARNLPNPVAAAVAAAALLAAGGLVAFGWWELRGAGEPASAPVTLAPSAAAPGSQTASDYGWLITAMAECEARAKHDGDAVHFLIVPVTATAVSLPGWAPAAIGTIGDDITLLQSTDTLIGLRNGALALYDKPVTFAFSDATRKTVYKWKPSVGVTALSSRELGAGGFALGLDITDPAAAITWGPTINLQKGTCYWINALVPKPRHGG
jgi:hypothetical protein